MERQPIFNVPATVTWLLSLLVAIHAVRAFLPAELDQEAVLSLAFIPARYGPLMEELPGGLAAAIASPVTHMLLHGDWLHLLLNSAWLLALGGAIARRIGGLRFLLLALASGLGGVVLFAAMNWGALAPMVGASGAISGLFAGILRFMFSGLRMGGLEVFSRAPRSIPRTPLSQVMRDPQILVVIAIWLALNLVMGLGGNPLDPMSTIAWEAHLGGFLTGLLTFAWFDTGAGPRREPPLPRAVLH